jgi:hypothetical protein
MPNNLTIQISFEIGTVNNRSMSMTIISNGTKIFEKNSFDQKIYRIEFATQFPSEIEFLTEGKKFDDSVVIDGQLTQDMYIKITKLVINNMPVKTWILEKCCFFGVSLDGQYHHTNYIGYNGKTTLSLKGKNLFCYFLNLLSST